MTRRAAFGFVGTPMFSAVGTGDDLEQRDVALPVAANDFRLEFALIDEHYRGLVGTFHQVRIG